MIENMVKLQKMDYPASLMEAIKQTIPIWYTRENGILGLSPLSDKEIADAFFNKYVKADSSLSFSDMETHMGTAIMYAKECYDKRL